MADFSNVPIILVLVLASVISLAAVLITGAYEHSIFKSDAKPFMSDSWKKNHTLSDGF